MRFHSLSTKLQPFKKKFLQGMVEPGEHISTTLKKEFMEEALTGLDMKDDEREELKRQVDGLFQEGVEVSGNKITFIESCSTYRPL